MSFPTDTLLKIYNISRNYYEKLAKRLMGFEILHQENENEPDSRQIKSSLESVEV